MIQYSHTDAIEDDLENDRRWFSTYRRWLIIQILILEKMTHPRSMMNMYDDVTKLPMTYRDSPVSCTVVVAISTVVEYFPS